MLERLATHTPTIIDDQLSIRAAVAVPIVTIDGEEHVVFTVRSQSLRRQPGEISFPGGHCEKEDSTGVDAAVRELVEELGIDYDQVEVLGQLDTLVSAIGVRLQAIAVRVHTLDFHPSEGEVDHVFTVPLKELITMKPQAGHVEVATKPTDDFPFHLLKGYNGDWKHRFQYPVYFYVYNNYVIWGLTARVLHNFLSIIKGTWIAE